MANAGLPDSVPIWVTENGWDSGASNDDATQDDALKQMVGAVVQYAGTYGVSDYRWFNLRDNQTGSSALFDTTGLLHDDYSPKPSFASLRALIAAHGAAERRCTLVFRLPRGARHVVVREGGRRLRAKRRGRRVTVRARPGRVVLTARGLRRVKAC